MMPVASESSSRRWHGAWRSRPASIFATLKGSGPNGRIVKADIEAALQKPAALPRRSPPPRPRHRRRRRALRLPITAPHRLVPHSTMRKVIARRLTEAKPTIPHFYVSMDVEIDALLKLRERSQREIAKGRARRLQALGQRPGDQGGAATLRRVPTRERRLDRGCDRACSTTWTSASQSRSPTG